MVATLSETLCLTVDKLQEITELSVKDTGDDAMMVKNLCRLKSVLVEIAHFLRKFGGRGYFSAFVNHSSDVKQFETFDSQLCKVMKHLHYDMQARTYAQSSQMLEACKLVATRGSADKLTVADTDEIMTLLELSMDEAHAELRASYEDLLTKQDATLSLLREGMYTCIDHGRECDCSCRVHSRSLLCCSLGSASALVTFICVYCTLHSLLSRSHIYANSHTCSRYGTLLAQGVRRQHGAGEDENVSVGGARD
jgi:hypothetical protein